MNQDRFQAQLNSGDVLDMDIIDQKIKNLNNTTLRETVMNFRKKGAEQHRLFVGVEKQWNGQGYKVNYPTIYKEEALEKMKGLFLVDAQNTIEKIK